MQIKVLYCACSHIYWLMSAIPGTKSAVCDIASRHQGIVKERHGRKNLGLESCEASNTSHLQFVSKNRYKIDLGELSEPLWSVFWQTELHIIALNWSELYSVAAAYTTAVQSEWADQTRFKLQKFHPSFNDYWGNMLDVQDFPRLHLSRNIIESVRNNINVIGKFLINHLNRRLGCLWKYNSVTFSLCACECHGSPFSDSRSRRSAGWVFVHCPVVVRAVVTNRLMHVELCIAQSRSLSVSELWL